MHRAACVSGVPIRAPDETRDKPRHATTRWVGGMRWAPDKMPNPSRPNQTGLRLETEPQTRSCSSASAVVQEHLAPDHRRGRSRACGIPARHPWCFWGPGQVRDTGIGVLVQRWPGIQDEDKHHFGLGERGRLAADMQAQLLRISGTSGTDRFRSVGQRQGWGPQ